jgi:hypothetical protein
MNIKSIFALACIAMSSPAFADISSIDIPGGASVAGSNWGKGFQWNVRAILLDRSLNPIGKLSGTEIFDTRSAPLTPQNATITLDSSASVGTVIRVYRSASPFTVGDHEPFADVTGLCPCTKGDIPIALPNSAFTASEATLPVKLQEFSVD